MSHFVKVKSLFWSLVLYKLAFFHILLLPGIKFENIIEVVEDDIPDINNHPVLVGEISLCDLTKCLKESGNVLKVFEKVKKSEIREIIDAIGATDLKEKRFAGKDKEENLKILSERLQKHVKDVCIL